MSNRDLIPEARADKNGRIVVRWIRRMFGSDKKASDVPKVSLLSAYVDASDRMELRDRLVVRYPLKEYTPSDDGSTVEQHLERHAKVRERETIDRAFKDRDLKQLQLLDKYMGKYSGGTISGVLSHLREIEGDETTVEVDDTLLSAYDSFHDAIPVDDENPRFDQWEHDETGKVGKYVLTHPEDVELVNTVVARGIIDCEEVVRAVESLKASDVPTVINDGFL